MLVEAIVNMFHGGSIAWNVLMIVFREFVGFFIMVFCWFVGLFFLSAGDGK
jgi:hypothetical protein